MCDSSRHYYSREEPSGKYYYLFIYFVQPPQVEKHVVSVLADHHPVTHQKELRNTQTTPDDSQYNIEWPEIKNISKSVPDQ